MKSTMNQIDGTISISTQFLSHSFSRDRQLVISQHTQPEILIFLLYCQKQE